MRKILMSDIKSGSENVKKVFRVPIVKRATLLNQMTFTNDELLEIIKLTELEDIQYHHQELFFEKLIISQPGPFSNEVIGKLIGYFQLYVPILKELLKKSSDQLSEEHKNTILELIIENIGRVTPDLEEEFGIDVNVYPYNVIVTARLIQHYKRSSSVPQMSAIFSMLDTMTEDQMIETYKKANSLSNNFEVFTQYSETPFKILDMLFEEYERFGDQFFHKLMVLAELPNASDDIKAYVYKKTGNIKYMPRYVSDLFIF